MTPAWFVRFGGEAMSTLYRWIGSVGPDWDSMSGTITNWLDISAGTKTIVPTSDTGDVAVFDDGGIHSVSGGGSADEFSITHDTTVTLADDPFEAGAFIAADNADFPYDLLVSDGGKLVVTSQLQSQGTVDVIGETDLFGGSGAGSLEVDAGAAYGTQGLILGDNTGGDGVVTINNAAIFTVVAPVGEASGDGALIIGYNATGSLDVTGTPYVFTESAVLGLNQGAVGSMTLDNSTWGGGDVTIGAGGVGHATIGAGAVTALHNFVVGSAEGASGDLTVTGANSFTTDYLTIGAAGTGTATFGADSTAMFGTVTVGSAASAVANMSLDGAIWSTATLTIGATGTGEVTAGDGEVVTVFGDAVLGEGADASGDLTVDGAVLNGGTLAVGQDGTGNLEIGADSSGSVSVVFVGEDQDSNGTLTIDGGADWNVGSLAVGLGGSGQATVGTGATTTVGSVLIGPDGNLAVTEAAGSAGTVVAQQVTIAFGTLDVSASGRVLVGAAAGVDGAVAIGSNSSLTGVGSLEGDAVLSDGGMVVATAAVPGALTIDGNVHGTGTIKPLMTLEVDGGIDPGVTIAFGPSSGAQTGALILDVPAANLGTIAGFALGNSIDIQGSLFDSAVFVQGTSGAAGTLTLRGSAAAPLSLAVEGTYAPDAFTATPGLTDTAVTLCFVAGTRIATPRGEVPVERLAVGEQVLTASGAARPIVWIGVGEVLATRGRRNAATPVIVRRGALANDVPNRDLRVTKGHALLIDDVLIPVEFLVNHRSIAWDDRAQEVRVYHIELAAHDVLVANGAPAESYRDDGNRWLFRNKNSRWGLAGRRPCAPVVTGGPVVDAVWRRLLLRSGPRRPMPLTDDPDLHLLADGARVDVVSRHSSYHVFRLAAPPASVRIVSRSGVPQELGLSRDARPLGVALACILVRQGVKARTLVADDALLSDGFHGYEADNGFRWTDGDAVVPSALLTGWRGPLEMVLGVAATAQYLDEGEVLRATG